MDAVVINFSHFHLVNELKGRHLGDEVLKATSDGIRAVIKDRKGIACRYDAGSLQCRGSCKLAASGAWSCTPRFIHSFV